jgi:hypothetical protein
MIYVSRLSYLLRVVATAHFRPAAATLLRSYRDCTCAWVAAAQRAFLPVTSPVPLRCTAQRLIKTGSNGPCEDQPCECVRPSRDHRRAPIIEELQSSKGSNHRRSPIIEGLQSSKGSNHRRAPIIEGLQSSKGSNHRRAPIIEGLQSSKVSNHRRAPIIEGLQSSLSIPDINT